MVTLVSLWLSYLESIYLNLSRAIHIYTQESNLVITMLIGILAPNGALAEKLLSVLSKYLGEKSPCCSEVELYIFIWIPGWLRRACVQCSPRSTFSSTIWLRWSFQVTRRGHCCPSYQRHTGTTWCKFVLVYHVEGFNCVVLNLF